MTEINVVLELVLICSVFDVDVEKPVRIFLEVFSH